MAATKERYQNPIGGDQLNLRLFVYNSNNLANVTGIEKVDIYFRDSYQPLACVQDCPNDWRLVETITNITQEDVGRYLVTLSLDEPKYCIGYYRDVWTLLFENEDCPATVTNPFQVYPDLWYTTPIPVVYDFRITFRPNKIRQGSKRYLICEITPNVPRGTDLARYYENLAIVSDLNISIEQRCGDCLPCEQDLRLIVDNQPVDYREKRYGYYLLDTTDMDCGIYNIWFELALGECLYITDKMQLQIF
jgi:hypothetical protein